METNELHPGWKWLGIIGQVWPAILTIAVIAFMLPLTMPSLAEVPAYLAMPEGRDPVPELPSFLTEDKTGDPEEQEETGGEDTEEDLGPVDAVYADGSYEGSAQGYGGTVSVRVTVSEGKITEVRVLSASGETESFFERARQVIDKVLTKQTWEVDTVSGATYSSRGILGAIQNALTGQIVENAPAPEPQQTAATPVPLEEDPFREDISFQDGTYTGTADGFGGDITVSVTVQSGTITDITVLSAEDETEPYLSRAKAVIAAMLSAQSTDVDTVSGATFSSTGIIRATRFALAKAAGNEENAGSGEDSGKATEGVEDPSSGESGDGNNTGNSDANKTILKDGSFGAVVNCSDGDLFDYTIEIRLVVKEGTVDSVDIFRTEDRSEDPEDNEVYFSRALDGRTRGGTFYPGLLSQISDGKDAEELDAVSGATYSSNAVIRAIRSLYRVIRKETVE